MSDDPATPIPEIYQRACLSALRASPQAFAHLPDRQWTELMTRAVEDGQISARRACAATAAREAERARMPFLYGDW